MTKITKAIIACGGWSTRFLPAVKAYAKHLVPILNKPQIQYVVEELIGAGIKNIAIVHRHGEHTIKRHFQPDPELRKYLKDTGKLDRIKSLSYIQNSLKTIKFIPQPRHLPYGNGTPILVAKSFIGSDPFIYAFGDDLTIEDKPGAFLKGAIDLFNKYKPAVVECVQQVPWSEVYRYGTVKYIKDPKYPNRISALMEKLPADQAPSNIIQCARFVVSPKIINILQKTAVAKDELWLTDAVNTLCQTDIVITHNYKENNALWATTGDPLRWLKANIILALRHPDFKTDIKKFLKNPQL